MNSILCVEYLPYHIPWRVCCTWHKTYELPEDGQQLRPKHFGVLINKWKALCKKWVLNFMYNCTVIYVNYSGDSINSAVFSGYGFQADNLMPLWELLGCVATNDIWLDDEMTGRRENEVIWNKIPELGKGLQEVTKISLAKSKTHTITHADTSWSLLCKTSFHIVRATRLSTADNKYVIPNNNTDFHVNIPTYETKRFVIIE
jgi:hypothetical protein